MSKKKIHAYNLSISPSQDERIENYLRQLDLFAFLRNFKKFSDQNIKAIGSPKDYLESLCVPEIHHRKNSRIKSLVLQAGLGKFNTIEELITSARNLNVNTNTNWRHINELAKCSFLEEHRNIIFLGQAGVGKTSIAKALGKKAIDKNFTVKFIELDKLIDNLLFRYKDVDSQRRFFNSLIRPDMLILDEVKNRETSPGVQDFLYRLINQRHAEKSIIYTTNKDLSEWEKLFGEYSEAALDRIWDKNYKIVIKIEGESYRAKG